jgi:hypothetical protein
VQAVGQERHEDVRLDALLDLVVDRAQVQIVLHGLEGGLDFDELDVEPPQFGRVFAGEIGAQQIAAFAPSHLAQLGAIEREVEVVPSGGTVTSTRRQAARALARAAPSFMSSSSRSSSMAAISLRRAIAI